MNRQLSPWHEGRRIGEYRRDGSGNRIKRAKVIVDGRDGKFYGIGSTLEEADAALLTFTNPECVCFPGEHNKCKIHPEVISDDDDFEGAVLKCNFIRFDPHYERWPSSGEKNDGNVDHEVLDEWGFR